MYDNTKKIQHLDFLSTKGTGENEKNSVLLF